MTYVRCVPKTPKNQMLWVCLCSHLLLGFRTTSRREARRVRASFPTCGGAEAKACQNSSNSPFPQVILNLHAARKLI